MLRLDLGKIHMEAMDSISGEPLRFIEVVIIYSILPVLGIMPHNKEEN